MTTWNETDLLKAGWVKQPDGSYTRPPVATRLQTAESQPRPVPPLAGSAKVQDRSPTRRRVRVTICTRRLLDPDNAVCKWTIDACRYFGLLADDTAAHITLEVQQVKVRDKASEGTLIEID